jgi:hypothetical protein
MGRSTFIYRAGTYPTPKGDFPERYAPGAFDSNIGKLAPLTIEGEQLGWVRILAADVIDDGQAVRITFEDVEPTSEESTP